jgi:ornithine carbamoyltransferase
MCNSYLEGRLPVRFSVAIAIPPGYEPNAGLLNAPLVAWSCFAIRCRCQKRGFVATDVWTSMGKEEERQRRLRDFAAYQVNAE